MESPEVVKTTMMINLLNACIKEYTAPNSIYGTIDFELFEKLWCFAFAWSIAGLLETKERQKFHKEVLGRVNAPLPKLSNDEETVFDFFVNPQTR